MVLIMSRIIIILTLLSLSLSASANPYEQMGNSLNDMIDIMANKQSPKPSQEETTTTYNNIGNFTYGSDGSSYYNSGDNSYGSNGYSYHQTNESNGYDSNGSTYQRIGDYIYINKPDGTRTVCYVSSVGTQCR